jgi:exonuclease SbcD
MRLLHTSGWHLGHLLYELPREREHAAFLDWLIDTLDRERVDAVVITGDLFDAAHPTPAAQKAWYDFLGRVWRRFPALQLVVIAGNHDSGARLDAPRPLYHLLERLHVVGTLPRREDGTLDTGALLVPLAGADGAVEAWIAAVPFLRPADLPPGMDLVDGVRSVYAEVLAAARARCSPGQALVATGHCYMVGGQVSELSERKIQVGNQQALPADVFDADVAYVALGHLHLAQRVGGRESVRYAGSPIPLSMTEAHYCHEVCIIDLVHGDLAGMKHFAVPRTIDLIRLPPQPKQAVLAALAALPPRAAGDDEALYPLVEVAVLVEHLEANLREELQAAIAGRAARLVRYTQPLIHAPGSADDSIAGGRDLDELLPEAVFRKRWTSSGAADDPPEGVLAAFGQLEEWARQPPREVDVDRERRMALIRNGGRP